MCARMASRCSISRCVGTVGVLGLVALLLGLPWLSPVRQAAVPTNLAPHSAAHAAREASDATSAGRTTVAAAPQLPGRRGYITTTAAESATSHALSLEPGSVVSDGQGKWFQVTEFVRSTAVEYRIDAQQPAIAADHTTVVRELSATGEVSNALAGTAPSLARPATEATHDDTSPPLLPDSAFTSPDAPDAPPNADESSSGEGFFTFGAYHSAERFQAGAHGEVWRGVRLSNGSSTQGGSSSSRKESVILKRIFVEKANGAYMSGLREIHFGILLRGCDHVVRFIESFNRTVPCPPATHVTACNGPQAVRNLTEMWLVFENGGTSLQQFLYKRTPLAGGSVLVEPSTFWQKLRTTSAGAEVLKELIRQVLMGLAQVHRQGVTHRDLKPGNVLVNVHNRSAASSAARIKLADFGSAVNRFASKHLYGDKGPTHEEETWEYRPPESVLGFRSDISAPSRSFDIWSLGVMVLEVLFGHHNVFSVSARVRIGLEDRLRAYANEELLRKAAYLSALADFCIYAPEHTLYLASQHEWMTGHLLDLPAQNDAWNQAKQTSVCGLVAFNRTLVRKDPIGRGFPDRWGLRLLWRMLQWDPDRRIRSQDALKHAYFQGPHRCPKCGVEFELPSELRYHVSHAHRHTERAAGDLSATMVLMRADATANMTFTCPRCNRSYSMHASCLRHVRARRHGTLCVYNDSVIPPCAPTPHLSVLESGVPHASCGIQGRRMAMEDFASSMGVGVDSGTTRVNVSVFGVFDGHSGTQAAAFAQHHLLGNLTTQLSHAVALLRRNEARPQARVSRDAVDSVTAAPFELARSCRHTFWELDRTFKQTHAPDVSGSTATVVAWVPSVEASGRTEWGQTSPALPRSSDSAVSPRGWLLVAGLGDSRAVACCNASGQAFALTQDHTASVPSERALVEQRGGFVEKQGVWRVQAQLVVTRSIGDIPFQHYITATPDVAVVRVHRVRFVILGTDGLWDVISNNEAAEMVQAIVDSSAERVACASDTSRHPMPTPTCSQSGCEANTTPSRRVYDCLLNRASTTLAHEAFLRGSLDNVYVLVIALV